MLKRPLLISNKAFIDESIFQGIVFEKSDVKKLIKENDCETQQKNLQIIFTNKIDGKLMSISFDENSTIFNMKNTVQRKTLLKFNDFYLEFHGEYLNNDKTMNYYQIVDKSIINIIGALKGGKNIQIQTVNGKIYNIEISDNENVLNLKSKIKREINFSENEQDLYFGNNKLENNQTIRDLQIEEGSIIRCVFKKLDINILVNILGKDNILLNVNIYDKTIDVKKKIKEKTGIDTDQQHITYHGVFLNDKKTLDSYGVIDGSVLMVVARIKGGKFQKEIIK